MAKSLKTLIRLAKWEVDQKRRALLALQGREDELIAHMRAAEEQLLREQAVAAADGEAGFLYGAYAGAWLQQRAQMEDLLAELRRQIEAARDDLSEAFRQHKTLEVTQANRDKRAREEADRKEQNFLDDVGLEMHRRKDREGG